MTTEKSGTCEAGRSPLGPMATLLAGAALGLSGCASAYLSSSKGASTTEEGQGISYYLPMRYAQLTFERTKTPDIAKAQADLKAAREELAKQQGIQKEATAARRSSETLLATYDARGVSKSAAAYLEAAQKLGAAEDSLKRVGPAIATANGAVNTAQANLNAVTSAQGSEYLDRFSISLLPYVADVKHRYVLKTRHRISRSETVNLKTTKSGLLSTVDSEATDKTQEILVSLAKAFAAGGGRIGMAPAPANARDPAARKNIQCETRIDRTVDISNPAHLSNFIDAVNEHPCSEKDDKAYEIAAFCSSCWRNDAALVDLAQRMLGESPVDTDKLDAAGLKREAITAQKIREAVFTEVAPAAPDAGDGIAYRRELPYLVSISRKNSGIRAAAFVVEVPNGAPVELLPMKVSTFGHVKRKAEFDNGMLVSLDSTADSELAKAAAVPFEIVKAVFGAVSELVQLKVDIATKDTGLAEQQTKLAEAQLKLDEALEKLEETRKAAEEETDEAADTATP
jgi:hypothetical protein